MPFDGALVLARLALYVDLAALAGLPLFWWSMEGPGAAAAGARRGVIAALALSGLALSGLWLLASAAGMAGTPLLPPDWSIVDILLKETPVGTMLAVRGAALVAILLLLFWRGRGWTAAVALAATVAVATLAWSGHAAASEGAAGSLHRIADMAHVLAAAGWFGALLVLLHAAIGRTHNSDDAVEMGRMLARFSLFGTLFVATLILTGAVNAAIIVGVANLPQLAHSLYGLLLLAKLALFGVMLMLAAINRWRLTPALAAAREPAGIDRARRRLRLSLLAETTAAFVILGLVAMLGTLDPLALP